MYSTLDMLPEGASLDRPYLIPHRWSDVIRPGLCDGFFAYPNNEHIWNEKYIRFAKKNNWLFFSQVSHPSGMRLCPWETCLALAKTRIPQNLGYFLFCPGNCAADRAWNADKGIPPGPKWNTRSVSQKLHLRRILAIEDVGMDIVLGFPAIQLLVDLPLNEAKPGGFSHPRVIVTNSREASFFLHLSTAVLQNVTVSLKVPVDFSLPEENSPPATLKLGALQPGERRVADWWLRVSENYTGKPRGKFIITARAKGCPPTQVELSSDTTIVLAQPHEIGISGSKWIEASYRLRKREVKPRIQIEALTDRVRNPGVGNKYATIRWNGVLRSGHRLVLDPQNGARLFFKPLVDDDAALRRDPKDAMGFKSFDRGYLVIRLVPRGIVDPTVPLRVTISGKAEGGANSLVVLRFATKKGSVDRSLLANRFSARWRKVSQVVSPPEGAHSLRNVFLYRFHTRGRIWYGPVKIERVDAKPEGIDVSNRLSGAFPSLSKSAFRVFHYVDDNEPSVRPRIKVQLLLP